MQGALCALRALHQTRVYLPARSVRDDVHVVH